MKIHEMQQRTPEWFAIRLGKITATDFATMANGKAASIETLCLKTAAERITGAPAEENYTNATMERGIEMEALARLAYETTTFNLVREVGFLELNEFVGASPDGLVGDDGGVEVKCPLIHTHLKYLAYGKKAWLAYKWQVQGALWVSGRKWWDFVSYHPAFPPDSQLFHVRVKPDDECFVKLRTGAEKCSARITAIIEEFQRA